MRIWRRGFACGLQGATASNGKGKRLAEKVFFTSTEENPVVSGFVP